MAYYLLLLTIAILPFQIRLIIPGNFSYFSGLYNEYASFSIHLSDLILLLTILIWCYEVFIHQTKIHLGNKYLNICFTIFATTSLLSTFFAKDPLLSIYHSFKIIEGYAFYLLIINQVAPIKHIIITLIGTFSFQSLLAIYQFIFQNSLGLNLLGEPLLQIGNPGIATINTPAGKIIRAYGTLPHPNILAGGLVITIISSLSLLKEKHYEKLIYATIFMLIALIFTLSRSAWLAIIAAALIIFALKPKQFSEFIHTHKRRILSFFAAFVILIFAIAPAIQSRITWEDSEAITGRITYARIAQNMIKDKYQFFTGVGTSNFTLRMQEYATSKIRPWNYQPIHNIFILTFAENGFINLVVLIAIFIQIFTYAITSYKEKTLEHASLIALSTALFILGSFDHYLLTLQQGSLLLWLSFAIISAITQKSLHAHHQHASSKSVQD